MNSNDKKYQEYKKKKILKYIVILLNFLTIVLESFALFGMMSYIWGLIPFSICYVVKYFCQENRESIKNKKR